MENPEARTEGLKWILLHESSIQKADCESLVKPLIACLTDRSKAIRELAENVGKGVMSLTGHPTFLNATKDRPQAVQQTLKPILERIKSECGAGAPEPAKKGGKPEAESPPAEAPPQMNSFARPKPGKDNLDASQGAKKSPRPNTAPPKKAAAAAEGESLTITP